MVRKESFGEILVRQGIVSPEQIAEAENMAKSGNMSVPSALERLGYATGDEVSRAIAQEHGMEFINIGDVVIPPNVVELVPESVARENAILPMSEEDGALKVIVSDPSDLDTQEKLRFILNREVRYALAPRESILEAINRYYGQTEGESADSMLQEFTDTAIDFTETEEIERRRRRHRRRVERAPIVRLVQMMISEAVQLRASDIHVEPFEDRVRVRYRIDGVLVERDSPPAACWARFSRASRSWPRWTSPNADSALRTAASRSPGNNKLDLRVSMLPTNHGQSVVMRILDKDNIKVGVRQLGFSDTNFEPSSSSSGAPTALSS